MISVAVTYNPNAKQYLFHQSSADEVIYGGAKGGGKSCALVIEAAAYACEYAGCTMYLFRETYDDLEANIIDEWIRNIPKELYSYNFGKHIATLYNGSRVLFRYVANATDAEGYQGRSMDWIGVDELTKHTERTIQLLLSCLRSAKGFPPKFRGTCNPGGRGHAWVKRKYITGTNHGKNIVVDELTGNTISFIPATVYDNTILMKNDPAYVKRLENLPEQERKAFLYGDWDVFIGQVFSEWRRDKHVVDPFEIPKGWPRWRALDWGFTKPYCVKWYTMDFDGKIVCYRELYGCKKGQLDVGTQETAKEVARHVKLLEADDGEMRGVADPACWARTGHNGPSIAEVFINEGVVFSPADNDRMQGKMQVHLRLRGWDYDLKTNTVKNPGLVFFSTCKHSIRTLPELIYDDKKVEDVDTTIEDHCYDTDRYSLMSRPWKPVKEKKRTHDMWDDDAPQNKWMVM
jgi:hypothetical protein